MLLKNFRPLRYPLAFIFLAATYTGNSQTQVKALKSDVKVHTVAFISPNPFHDVVNLSSDAVRPRYRIQIFSLIGVLVYSHIAESTIHLPRLPRGIYLARLTNERGQQVMSQKIVKI